MRKKLIHLHYESQPVEVNDGFVRAVIDLRCDKCKHWSGPGTMTREGCCDFITYSERGESARVTEPGYMKTLPDFFCALWEKK